MITSACRGVALATSNPNLDQSYFAAAVDIISIAQQLVPNTNGHNELERAQLITSSSLVTSMPPPAVGETVPGNFTTPSVSSTVGEIFSDLSFAFRSSLIYDQFFSPRQLSG